jgi:hypothetical protein
VEATTYYHNPSLGRRQITTVSPFSSLKFEFSKTCTTLRYSCTQGVIRCLFAMPKTNTIDDIPLHFRFLLSLSLCVVPSPSQSCIAPTYTHPIPQHFHLSARVPLPLENSTPRTHFPPPLAMAVSAESTDMQKT